MRGRRSGFSLIEMLVVITLIGLMLTLCGGMVHLLLKLDRSGRMALDESADLKRLAHDFRNDVHASSPDLPTGTSTDRITLNCPDVGSVEYQVRPKDVLRTVREGTKVRRFEIYRRPAHTSTRFEATREGPRLMARLIFDRPLDGHDSLLYHDFRIEAEAGRDRRNHVGVE